MEKLLKELCQITAVSGDEPQITQFIQENLKDLCHTEVNVDGSLIASIGPKNARNGILFDAHIDQIGLIVTYVDKSGFLKFAACGGMDPRILYGQSVVIHSKLKMTGIICSTPGHLKDSNQRGKFPDISDLVVDVGTDDENVLSAISVGDKISFKPNFKKLLNDNFASPSTDDRAGVCIMLKLAQALSKQNSNQSFTVLFSSKEEVGTLGAKTSAFKCDPSQAISVDVSFAKQHDLSENNYAELGKGPMIGIAPILSKNISNLLVDIAMKNGIPYQIEVMGGKSGTNADSIVTTKSGIPCGLVSIPQRYMHSNVEMVNIHDLENTFKLLLEYAKAGGVKNER